MFFTLTKKSNFFQSEAFIIIALKIFFIFQFLLAFFNN